LACLAPFGKLLDLAGDIANNTHRVDLQCKGKLVSIVFATQDIRNP